MSDAPLTYSELMDLAARMPRRPRYELHVHPNVLAPLREHAPPSASFLELAGSGLLFSGIPVIEHEDYPAALWRLYKDGLVHDSGFIPNLKEKP